MNAPARFVVGTGRCGSTLLSRMLSENAQVLNVFELFSGIDQFFRFERRDVEGPELAAQLRLDHPMLTMVMKRGGAVPEVVYPFDDPNTRHVLGDPVPWALAIAVPRISDDPDALFDEMIARAEAAPRQPLSKHYRELFDWLTETHGKTAWIERSGSSIDFLGELFEFFPDARFVHIHRDGHEATLSMREYAVLRVTIAVMNGVLGDVEYSHDGLVALEQEKPEEIDRLLATRSPIELFGKYWSDQILNGLAARRAIPDEKFLDVRFEDLVIDPARVLHEIADFFELSADGDWIERAAALSRGMPRLRAPDLDDDERSRLEASCAEAMKAIGR
jgi:hypothetical protein